MLGYFMVLFLVITVFILSCLSMAGGYYTRTADARDREQAFHTAYGIAEALAGEFTKKEQGMDADAFMAVLGSGEEMEITGLPEKMGRCLVRAEYGEETGRLELRVLASCGTQKQSVTAVLLYSESEGQEDDRLEPEGTWELAGYKNGETKQENGLE